MRWWLFWPYNGCRWTGFSYSSSSSSDLIRSSSGYAPFHDSDDYVFRVFSCLPNLQYFWWWSKTRIVLKYLSPSSASSSSSSSFILQDDQATNWSSRLLVIFTFLHQSYSLLFILFSIIFSFCRSVLMMIPVLDISCHKRSLFSSQLFLLILFTFFLLHVMYWTDVVQQHSEEKKSGLLFLFYWRQSLYNFSLLTLVIPSLWFPDSVSLLLVSSAFLIQEDESDEEKERKSGGDDDQFLVCEPSSFFFSWSITYGNLFRKVSLSRLQVNLYIPWVMQPILSSWLSYLHISLSLYLSVFCVLNYIKLYSCVVWPQTKRRRNDVYRIHKKNIFDCNRRRGDKILI